MVISNYLEKAKNSDLNTFVHIHDQYIKDHMADFLQKPFSAAPVAIKDLILTKGYATTACS
jgi:Asp-tRNA(Asn)/Glu-tRNA(Gln) amidotransferase A subunit family amidase